MNEVDHVLAILNQAKPHDPKLNSLLYEYFWYLN